MFLIQSNLEQPQQHHNICTRIRLQRTNIKRRRRRRKLKKTGGQENNKAGSSERGRTGRLGNDLWLDLVLVLEELWCLLVGW
jgi:hypothetical protein